MNFLNSPYLWGGLIAAGVAVPIIIHLLSRYRSRPVEWAAMELLRRAMIVRARHVRLEDLILLMLRCLAIALVGLALARPAINTAGTSWFGGGGQGRAGIVIAVDGSYSMVHKPGVRSRFELATDRAREVLQTVSAGSPVTLILLGNKPRILLRNAPYDAERTDVVLKALEPLDETLNLDACMEELNRLVVELRAPSRECYVITDAQAASWQKVSENTRRSMEKIAQSGALLFVPTGANDSENLAITRFALASGILRKNSEGRYVADVMNSGRVPRSGVNVQLYLNNVAVDQRIIENIAPGKTETVSLFVRFDKAGSYGVSAKIGSDALQLDNARYAVANIRESVRVLCVDGDPSEEPYRSATDFLVDALLPWGTEGVRGGGASPLKVDKIRVEDFRIAALSTCDIVVLANVPEVIREHAIALADFVRRGGGLMVFLGDKVNAEMTNRRLQDANGHMLLPGKLVEAVNGVSEGRKESGAMIAPKMLDHPLTRFFATMPIEQWAQISFTKHFKVIPSENATVLLRLAGSDDPLLIEQQYGRGHVILFTSSADREWTDMPVHPAYLMLVQQAVTHMTRRSSETPVTVSESIMFEIATDDESRAATVANPRGVESSVRVVDRDGKAAVLPSADYAGIYEARTVKTAAVVKSAANTDAAESDVTALEGEALRVVASALPVRLVKESETMRSVARECRFGRELWPILLVLALCVLGLEAVLARRFVRRMDTVPEE